MQTTNHKPQNLTINDSQPDNQSQAFLRLHNTAIGYYDFLNICNNSNYYTKKQFRYDFSKRGLETETNAHHVDPDNTLHGYFLGNHIVKLIPAINWGDERHNAFDKKYDNLGQNLERDVKYFVSTPNKTSVKKQLNQGKIF